MPTKYIGTILEGRWEVVERIDYRKFKLKNIYNETIITVRDSVFYKILKKETTISKIISLRINPTKFNKQKKLIINNRKFEQKNRR